MGATFGRWPLIAAILETAVRMSDEAILIKLSECSRRKLFGYKTELLHRRRELLQLFGHINGSFIDRESLGAKEYETLIRLTDLVTVAISRKQNETSAAEFNSALTANTNDEELPTLPAATEAGTEKAKAESYVEPSPERGSSKRLPATVTSAVAARRMDQYLRMKSIGQTEFAKMAQTTDRTLRSFRKSGKVRRDIFDNIAKAMGITRDDVLMPE
jgi:hypothetical protein